MKTPTKLNIVGYTLLALSWFIWFMPGDTELQTRFWIFSICHIGALVSFGACLGWTWLGPLFQAALKRPPQDDGEPRSE